MDAMVALAVLYEKTATEQQVCVSEKLNAATAMVGIIYHNQFAGRVGKWENMLREDVAAQIAAGADYLPYREHQAVLDHNQGTIGHNQGTSGHEWSHSWPSQRSFSK